mmetsp:Transcript_44185/g.86707  ORF Transcript_44185/g.86707 Transcript_44185/m.86707 type:complete len:85 (-) Transcript_44185:231-485(-)
MAFRKKLDHILDLGTGKKLECRFETPGVMNIASPLTVKIRASCINAFHDTNETKCPADCIDFFLRTQIMKYLKRICMKEIRTMG